AYSGTLYKLNDQIYLIDMTGTDSAPGLSSQQVAWLTRRGGGASQRLGMLATIRPLQMAIRAALNSGRGDALTGQATIDGYANITLPGQNFNNNIGPVVTNGQCDKSVLTNWGDPMNPGLPCGGYFPIVHITGSSVTINGVQGQGILLVDGSLAVQGGFQWFGITIIRGTFSTAGGGTSDAHFWGTTMVQDSVVVANNTYTGHAHILYSKCAILKALDATGVA